MENKNGNLMRQICVKYVGFVCDGEDGGDWSNRLSKRANQISSLVGKTARLLIGESCDVE